MPRSETQKRSTRRPVVGVSLLALSLPLLAQVGCSQVRYTEAFMPEGEVRRVVVEVDAGQIEVVAGESLRVERDIRAPEPALQLSHEVEADGTLRIGARCVRMLPCAVDTRLQVPAGLPVEIDLGQGDVWVTGIERLSLDLGEGAADVDVSGTLTASVGSGALSARLAAGQDARVGVGAGDILVEVPEGAWRVDADASRLQLQGVDSDVDAPELGGGHLELVAPAGTVTVRSGAGVANR